jgi:hypothetical protein
MSREPFFDDTGNSDNNHRLSVIPLMLGWRISQVPLM